MPLHRLRAVPDPRIQGRFLASIPKEVTALRGLIRELEIDVVQIGGLVNPHAAIAARLEGVGIVWQILDTRPPMALRRLMMPWVRVLADAVMTTGTHVAEVHPGARSLGPRLVPFYPPVDTMAFRPDPAWRVAARAELGVQEGTLLVGSVANLTPQKGLEHFIAVADLIHASAADALFVIFGSVMATHSAYEKRLRSIVAQSAVGRAGVLRIIDPGSRVAELLNALDLFLLTSVPRSEGVSTTVLEAMATGIPVVSTDVGALREVVEPGVTGAIVPPLDDEAMARAVEDLIADATLRREMGKRARQRAVERYDVEVCAEVHLRAYQMAAARAARRRSRRGSRGAC